MDSINIILPNTPEFCGDKRLHHFMWGENAVRCDQQLTLTKFAKSKYEILLLWVVLISMMLEFEALQLEVVGIKYILNYTVIPKRRNLHQKQTFSIGLASCRWLPSTLTSENLSAREIVGIDLGVGQA